jgi:mRNA interferase RelE/StbE
VNTSFRASFDKDLAAVTDAGFLRRVQKMIEQVEAARNLHEIPNLKRLEAKGKYFRIRLGDYRVGLVFEQGAVTFVRCLHRREIYRYSP